MGIDKGDGAFQKSEGNIDSLQRDELDYLAKKQRGARKLLAVLHDGHIDQAILWTGAVFASRLNETTNKEHARSIMLKVGILTVTDMVTRMTPAARDILNNERPSNPATDEMLGQRWEMEVVGTLGHDVPKLLFSYISDSDRTGVVYDGLKHLLEIFLSTDMSSSYCEEGVYAKFFQNETLKEETRKASILFEKFIDAKNPEEAHKLWNARRAKGYLALLHASENFLAIVKDAPENNVDIESEIKRILLQIDARMAQFKSSDIE